MPLEIKMGTKESTESSFEPYKVNGYEIKEKLTNNNSGNAMWGFCEKFGREFFIKEFVNPKYPSEDAELSDKFRENQIRACNEWFKERTNVYAAIMKSSKGNLVVPMDFFKFENRFYLITEKVDAHSLKFENIYQTSMEQRHMLLKVLASEFTSLADHGIIHSDIKPDNIIFKSTVMGYFTVKIIDFDASFFAEKIPDPESLQGDQAYFSPEYFLYLASEGEEGTITLKTDVFSLGLLFHQILCGVMPKVEGEFSYITLPDGKKISRSIGDLILDGHEPTLSEQISPSYRELIRKMLIGDPEKRISMRQVFQELCSFESKSSRPGGETKTSGPWKKAEFD